jgi:hypothetical protein
MRKAGGIIAVSPTDSNCWLLVDGSPFRDPEPSVVDSALRALASIALQAAGAAAVCEAGAPERFDQLLESSDSGVRKWTCYLLGNIARFDSTEVVARKAHQCRKLVELSGWVHGNFGSID